MELLADPNRYEKCKNLTGIFVRGKNPKGKYEPLDIAQFDSKSLLEWLRSRGGENKWAENVVGILLGHGNIIE